MSGCWRRTTPTTAWHVSCIAALAPERRPLPDHLVPLGRTVGLPINGAVSNLALSSRGGGNAGTGAAPRRLRRGPRARAQRAVRELVRHRGRPRPAGGHLPLLLAQPALQRVRRQRGRRAPALQQAARADRGLRGRALDLRALLRRPLPDRPQRRGPVRRATVGRAGRRTRWSCSSSAARRPARDCPCSCAPSRPCAAPGSAPGSPLRGPPRRRCGRCSWTPRACAWPAA